MVDSAPGSPHTVSLSGTGSYSEPYGFFYQDARRSYYVSLPQAPTVASMAGTVSGAAQEAGPRGSVSGTPWLVQALAQTSASAITAKTPTAPTPMVQFYNHFHPHVCALVKAFNENGIPGVLTLASQALSNDRVIDHFYTTYAPERDNAVNQLGYLDEGVSCYVYGSQTPGTVPFFRLRNQEHFYTSDATERQNLLSTGWIDEGIACYLLQSQSPGTVPLYRLYSPILNIHFYTCSQSERNLSIETGYNYQGIPGYVYIVPTTGTIPFYWLVSVVTAFEQNQNYSPTPLVQRPYPSENIDFSYAGAYSLYNWELFFHAPMLVASRLAANQRFEDAMQWYHYIFDPTLGDNPWRVLPFQTSAKDGIEYLVKLLEYTGSDANLIEAKNNFENQLNEWTKDPFNPHAVARLRLIAYQKNVVMKYLDNLIAWGDQLFR